MPVSSQPTMRMPSDQRPATPRPPPPVPAAAAAAAAKTETLAPLAQHVFEIWALRLLLVGAAAGPTAGLRPGRPWALPPPTLWAAAD